MEPLHFNDYRDPQLVIFVEVNGVNFIKIKLKLFNIKKGYNVYEYFVKLSKI